MIYCVTIRKEKKKNLDQHASYLRFDQNFIKLHLSESILSLDFQIVNWPSFDEGRWYSKQWSSSKGDKIDKLEIFAEGSGGHLNLVATELDNIVWQKIFNAVGEDASIYLKVHAENKLAYHAAIKSKRSHKTYVSGLFNNEFIQCSSFHITTQNETYSHDHTERIEMFSSSERIIPYVISNERFINTGLDKVKLLYGGSDSIHVLIKTESGELFKHHFSDLTQLEFSDLLDNHIISSTVYICIGDPDSAKHRVAVINISDDNKLIAVDTELLQKLVGIDINQIAAKQVYFRNEDMNFVWGDLQLTLTKNKAGNYFAKKRIGRSALQNIHAKEPNLVLGRHLRMDSLLFNISMSTQDVDTMNRVRFKDYGGDSFTDPVRLNLLDTLKNLANEQESKTIVLEDIKNEAIGEANISLELEVYDDSPVKKKKKYQFHWGHIDTTLTQKSKSGIFSQSVALSLSKFLSKSKKEPVLTSSEKGVVDAFECNIKHFRGKKLLNELKVKSDIKDQSVFENSIKNLDFSNTFKVGDKVLLHAFSSPEISSSETLHVEIQLLENTIEDNTVSIDDKNLFLQWGDLKLKSTPLGDDTPKKRIQDQVIAKDKLEEIIYGNTFLNKYGLKENIVSAEWFVNDNIYAKSACENKDWKDCFSQQLDRSRSGDFISIFMRTSNGAGVMSQFYLDYVSTDAIIGFGDTQFDSLLFKYSKYAISKLNLPQYEYEFSWGASTVPLELKGNPRVYGGKITVSKAELKSMVEDKIDILSSDGEVISVKEAYLIIYKNRPEDTKRKFYHFDFVCEEGDCSFASDELERVIADLEGQVFGARVFINQHVPSEERIKVSFIDYVVKDDSYAWMPKRWLPSKYPTDLFEFQFVYQEKEKTLIKFDQENEKYKWMIEKYKNDASVELIDLPNFKTTHRAIYTKYNYGNHESIRNTQVLSKNYTNAYTLYEYHDLKSKKVNLYWKGYAPHYGLESYCNEDFVCAEGGLELTINGELQDIVRGDIVILPESGMGSKFVFDDISCDEIISILNEIPPYTSVFFENLIIEGERNQHLRLPLKFVYHIE